MCARRAAHLLSAAQDGRRQDVASAVLYIVTRPWRMSVNEILIRPTEQDS